MVHDNDAKDKLAGKSLPVGRYSLGKLGRFHKGSGISKSELADTGIPCLRYAEIYTTYGNTIYELRSRVSAEIASKAFAIEHGDIIFAGSGETQEDIGKATAYLGEGKAVVGSDTVILRGHGQDPSFLAHALSTDDAIRQKGCLGKGQSIVHIHAPDLSKIEVWLAPMAEQRWIAGLLQTWDEAIQKYGKLRAAKQQRLDVLRSGLLFGSLRLDRKRANWRPRRLSEVTFELSDRNTDLALGREMVMGVTNSRGIVPMREHSVAKDISRYKRLPSRAFAYNPMRINVGSIAMNEGETDVLVSPDYVAFACKTDGLEPDYLNHLRKTQWWAHYITSGGSGSVRQRTYYDDLAALHLPLPGLDEQRRIVNLLNAARSDLDATERMVASVTRQKRGLMQKLLTGQWRVSMGA
ncbi:MAG: hypothetical protein JNK21_04615 [Rhodospirillaceae bacterium]|nr:hypothetical protein [Rhodospirillaceae bacterium]